jgi:hypothetical protein
MPNLGAALPQPAAAILDPAAADPNLAAVLPNLAAAMPDLAAANPNPVAANPDLAAAVPNPAEHIEGKLGWLSYKDLMATTYPVKSRKVYLASYASFENYLRRQELFVPDVAPTELSCMNYFHHLREDKKWASSTLWSHFSRVNAVTKRTWGMNLATLPRLTGLLKAYESGHRVKKACVFTPQQAR